MSNIFRKGKKQLYNQLIKPNGVSKLLGKQYYDIIDLDSKKKHLVTVHPTSDGTIFDCDCTFMSLPRKENLIKGKQALCSHTITVILEKCSKERIK